MLASAVLTTHPLLPVLVAAADGAFPPVDGAAVLLPPLADGVQAVVSFTGRAFVATSLHRAEFTDVAMDGYGGALHPQLLLHLAGRRGAVGLTNLMLAGRGHGRGGLPERDDAAAHPRVRYALALRRDVRVYGDERGLVTLALGVAGRRELSIEVEASRHGTGAGRALVHDALGLVPAGEPVFAAVSPGNARSLPAFLAAGFTPLGSEVLITP